MTKAVAGYTCLMGRAIAKYTFSTWVQWRCVVAGRGSDLARRISLEQRICFVGEEDLPGI